MASSSSLSSRGRRRGTRRGADSVGRPSPRCSRTARRRRVIGGGGGAPVGAGAGAGAGAGSLLRGGKRRSLPTRSGETSTGGCTASPSGKGSGCALAGRGGLHIRSATSKQASERARALGLTRSRRGCARASAGEAVHWMRACVRFSSRIRKGDTSWPSHNLCGRHAWRRRREMRDRYEVLRLALVRNAQHIRQPAPHSSAGSELYDAARAWPMRQQPPQAGGGVDRAACTLALRFPQRRRPGVGGARWALHHGAAAPQRCR
eukprot:scaffold1284_cov353-Prasinococcus_capsulatus_cf.AAC.11